MRDRTNHGLCFGQPSNSTSCNPRLPLGSLDCRRKRRLDKTGIGGLGAEVKCHRCKTRASLPLDAIRRPRDTPIRKLEAALKCRSCRMGRYTRPVHMIKLTEWQAGASHCGGDASPRPRRSYQVLFYSEADMADDHEGVGFGPTADVLRHHSIRSSRSSEDFLRHQLRRSHPSRSAPAPKLRNN